MVSRPATLPACEHACVTTDRDRTAWADHAADALAAAGLRTGGARAAVIGLLARQDCCVSAQEIRDALAEEPGPTPGMASVYRALDTLTALDLVHKVELGGAVAKYEPAHPGGEHHHHAVCRRCGAVIPIADDGLERALHGLADRLAFTVDAHDITLHGRCERCELAQGPALP
jgi:Fur family transcriptional regulator, ferric uptake regulator